MKLTIFSANCVGNPANALYPNKAEIENKEDSFTYHRIIGTKALVL